MTLNPRIRRFCLTVVAGFLGLAAIGIWVVVITSVAGKAAKSNLELTKCNQALLTYNATGVLLEEEFDTYCTDEVKQAFNRRVIK